MADCDPLLGAELEHRHGQQRHVGIDPLQPLRRDLVGYGHLGAGQAYDGAETVPPAVRPTPRRV